LILVATVVALLRALQDAVATHCLGPARRRATVSVDYIAIVTLFDTGDGSVAAHRLQLTRRRTPVSRHVVARRWVALLPTVGDPVTTQL
jgi:hypothetical protein